MKKKLLGSFLSLIAFHALAQDRACVGLVQYPYTFQINTIQKRDQYNAAYEKIQKIAKKNGFVLYEDTAEYRKSISKFARIDIKLSWNAPTHVGPALLNTYAKSDVVVFTEESNFGVEDIRKLGEAQSINKGSSNIESVLVESFKKALPKCHDVPEFEIEIDRSPRVASEQPTPAVRKVYAGVSAVTEDYVSVSTTMDLTIKKAQKGLIEECKDGILSQIDIPTPSCVEFEGPSWKFMRACKTVATAVCSKK